MNTKFSNLAALMLCGCLVSASALGAADGETLAEAFKTLDSNGDGFITLEEAEVDLDLVTSFPDGDDDDNGRLSFAEFSKMEIVDE